jgi:hypothetical protein
VYVAAPHGCCRPRRDLGRILGQHLSKVFGALSAANVVSLRLTLAARRLRGAWRTKGIVSEIGVRMTGALPSRRWRASLGSVQRLYAALSMPRDRVQLCER